MSGKGKGKRRDRIKSKPDEIEFNGRCINLKRFAYDVIKFTALRFRVPESCIAVWDDKHNDYGKDNFLLAVCMQIIEYQITYRHQYHSYFSRHYEENKLATPELIDRLLSEAIHKETGILPMTIIGLVDLSLSIACELYLFLYSKNIDLNPKKLATTWFDCTKRYKKKFEKVEGLMLMYRKGCEQNLDSKDAFLNKFIEAQCLPYHTSVNSPVLGKRFFVSNKIFNISAKSLLRKGTAEVHKHTILDDLADTLTGFKIDDEPLVPDAATGFNLPESTGLGLTPLDQAIKFSGSSVALSHDLPVPSPEEQLRHFLNVSQEERTKRIRTRMRSSREQAIGRLNLDSSAAKRSSDQTSNASIATSPAQSYELQGAKPKDRVQNIGSSDLQTEPSKQGIRQSTLDSLGKQSSDQKVSTATGAAQSYEHQEARPKDRVQNIGSSDLQTGESSGTSGDKIVE